MGWGRTIRGLREQTIPLGWKGSEAGQLSTVVHPSREVAIAVATGNEGTGIAGAIPRTTYPKGRPPPQRSSVMCPLAEMTCPRPPEGTFDPAHFIRTQLTSGARGLYGLTHREIDRVLLKMVLEHASGGQREAARVLGISSETIRAKLRLLGMLVAQAVESEGSDDA